MNVPLSRVYFTRGIQIGPIQARELTSALWDLHLHSELHVLHVESHGTVGTDDKRVLALVPLFHVESMEPDITAMLEAAPTLPPVTDSVSLSPPPSPASPPPSPAPSRPPGRPRTKRMGVE